MKILVANFPYYNSKKVLLATVLPLIKKPPYYKNKNLYLESTPKKLTDNTNTVSMKKYKI